MENALIQLGAAAKKAAQTAYQYSDAQKAEVLNKIADALIANQDGILQANAEDLKNGKENGLSDALLDRLALSPQRIAQMADGVRQVALLPDPVGEVVEEITRPNGLNIQKVRVPLGVIGIIYEARPNVTVDAAALCFRAGNVCILRGGKEAICANRFLVDLMRDCFKDAGFSPDFVQLVQDTSRQSATDLMNLTQYLDVLIPRGGAGLIRAVTQNAHVPVIRTGEGNCHLYVDKAADLPMAVNILINAKASRPSVCNACESLLVHSAVAKAFYALAQSALQASGITVFGCKETCALLPGAQMASEADYATEYLDYKLSAKVVGSLEEALTHIAKYTTGHSECIITDDPHAAEEFLNGVDAAAVYVNASTRFTDGGEFGFGAEIGISTQKLHARGPMGLKELTSYQYRVRGNGQVR